MDKFNKFKNQINN